MAMMLFFIQEKEIYSFMRINGVFILSGLVALILSLMNTLFIISIPLKLQFHLFKLDRITHLLLQNLLH